jgi:membrane protein YqaA with SNARE-associated domain
MSMVTWAGGNADLQPLYKNSTNPVAASILGALFVFILGTVLLNLLVGIVTNSLERMTSDEASKCMSHIGFVFVLGFPFQPCYACLLAGRTFAFEQSRCNR